jgi:hypothetical protein
VVFDERRHLVDRQEPLRRTAAIRLAVHAEDDAGVFILRNSRGARFLELQHSGSAVGTHAGQEKREGIRSGTGPNSGVEENIHGRPLMMHQWSIAQFDDVSRTDAARKSVDPVVAETRARALAAMETMRTDPALHADSHSHLFLRRVDGRSMAGADLLTASIDFLFRALR